MRKLSVIATTSIMGFCCTIKSSAFEVGDFPPLLTVAGELPLHRDYDEAAKFSTRLKFQINVSGPEAAKSILNAGLRLWIQNQHDYLLVRWFQENSREKRMLICSMFLCDRVEMLTGNTQRVMDFEAAARRFSEPEAKERLEEIKFVVTNIRNLSRQFDTAFAKVLENDRREGFQYTANLSEVEYDKIMKFAPVLDK